MIFIYRTGSSFVGTVLSAAPDASYMYEPLALEPFSHFMDDERAWNISVRSVVKDYITNLFNCDNVN